MATAPMVSLCVPTYQAEAHIEQTLRSVMAQTYANLEIIVLDNACTDRTPELLADLVAEYDDPRLRVVRNETVLPMADNWNHVVGLARGDLVKVVCADDLLHPDAVAEQVQVLDTYPQVSLVSCRRHLIGEDSEVLAAGRGLSGLVGLRGGRNTVNRVVRHGGNPIGEPVCVTFRRQHFAEVGGFDASLVFPMDIDLWVKLMRHGDFYGMPQVMAAFRAGASSISAELTAAQYADQRTLNERIVADPFWRVGRTSRLVGKACMLGARTRHRALFLVSAWSHRQSPRRGGRIKNGLDWTT